MVYWLYTQWCDWIFVMLNGGATCWFLEPHQSHWEAWWSTSLQEGTQVLQFRGIRFTFFFNKLKCDGWDYYLLLSGWLCICGALLVSSEFVVCSASTLGFSVVHDDVGLHTDLMLDLVWVSHQLLLILGFLMFVRKLISISALLVSSRHFWLLSSISSLL